MELVGLWRYPVKSMQGEPLNRGELGRIGIDGDRRWAVQDAETGRILSAKREGRLLMARAATRHTVLISLPTGDRIMGAGTRTDAILSRWLERPVHLVEADLQTTPTFESQADETDDDSDTVTWQGPPGAFVDSSPVHLLTTASLRALRCQRSDLDWQVSRFRPNLLIEVPGDERVEDAWVGRHCSVGEVEVEIFKPCGRCVMTTRAQPGGVTRQLGVLTHLNRAAEGTLGVLGRVVRPGLISLHDPVAIN